MAAPRKTGKAPDAGAVPADHAQDAPALGNPAGADTPAVAHTEGASAPALVEAVPAEADAGEPRGSHPESGGGQASLSQSDGEAVSPAAARAALLAEIAEAEGALAGLHLSGLGVEVLAARKDGNELVLVSTAGRKYRVDLETGGVTDTADGQVVL